MMFEGLTENDIQGALEALLFVTDEPMSALSAADMLGIGLAEAETALRALQDSLAQRRGGIVLREVAGGWRLFTDERFHELIERYVVSWDTRKLTAAALEVLAIVAYTQPVTRAGINAVRGVNSESSLTSLVEKGLVREAGTADAPGNPMQYATTRVFLEKFGLRSVADLPPLEDFAPDDETRRLIRERLSATSMQDASFEASGETDGAFDRAVFDFGEAADASSSGQGKPEGPEADAAAKALGDAMAAALGVVEKIDFDKLSFDFGDD